MDEIFARRFWLVNLAYRFPLWPGQERVTLQVLADYARVTYLPGHRLPHSGLTVPHLGYTVTAYKELKPTTASPSPPPCASTARSSDG